MAIGTARPSQPGAPGRGLPLRRSARAKQPPEPSLPAVTLKKHFTATVGVRLVLSIDYGTKTVAVAWYLPLDNDAPGLSKIRTVHFSKRDYAIPQKVAWAADGTFYWGYHLERALEMRLVHPDAVIELWKLLLYEDHKTSDLAKDIEKRLGDRSLDELISTHLREIIKEAITHIKHEERHGPYAQDIDNLPVELFLSVPQMWKDPANHRMAKAAKMAGVDRVELVYEPENAVAYFTHHMMDHPTHFSVDDIILVADIGGGTGDFVSVKYGSSSNAGATVVLQILLSTGALCGSEFVNRNFNQYLVRLAAELGMTLEEMCAALGLTLAAFQRKALKEFENIKQDFIGYLADDAHVTVYGAQGAARYSWQIRLTCGDIEMLFRPVIQEIFDCVDEHFKKYPQIKEIIVPGGFGRSEYLLNQLDAHFEGKVKISGQAIPSVGAGQSIAEGGPLRFKYPITRGAPHQASFGIARVEDYDPLIHPNDVHNIAISPHDGRQILHERWCPIIKKGTDKTPGKPFSSFSWLQFVLPKRNREIAVQIYWTESDVQLHEAIRTGPDPGSPLKAGILAWDEPFVFQLPNLKRTGFRLKEGGKEGDVYEIYFRVVMRCDGANISVRGQMALPGTPPYDAEGARREVQVELTDDQVFELCDAEHNPFPRSNIFS